MQDPLIGKSRRGYTIRRQVGSGGQGIVYQAYQEAQQRPVALKVVYFDRSDRDQEDTIRRFKMEAVIAFRLSHPHIIPLYDYWTDEDGIWIATRWMEGGSLRDRLQAGPLTPADAAAWLDPIADALALAHQKDIIHRDLKPDNILFDADHQAYLTDFGMAKRLNATTMTNAGVSVGSPAYFAPEQVHNENIGPHTDVYALGITLFECLAGTHPFGNIPPIQMIMKHVQAPLPSLRRQRPELPAAVDAVIQRATAKAPGDRYPDVRSLAQALRQATDG